MTDIAPEPVDGEEAWDVEATGHLEGRQITVIAKLGGAKVTLEWNVDTEAEAADTLVAALPQAAVSVIEAISAALDEEEATGE